MSRCGGSASHRWSPPSHGWGRNDWHGKNWPKEAARNDGDSWRTDRSRRAYSESAPGPKDAKEAIERYAWKSCARSKGTASAEPSGIVVSANSSSSNTGTPLDIRRRVEDLSAAARGFPRSLERHRRFRGKSGSSCEGKYRSSSSRSGFRTTKSTSTKDTSTTQAKTCKRTHYGRRHNGSQFSGCRQCD